MHRYVVDYFKQIRSNSNYSKSNFLPFSYLEFNCFSHLHISLSPPARYSYFTNEYMVIFSAKWCIVYPLDRLIQILWHILFLLFDHLYYICSSFLYFLVLILSFLFYLYFICWRFCVVCNRTKLHYLDFGWSNPTWCRQKE